MGKNPERGMPEMEEGQATANKDRAEGGKNRPERAMLAIIAEK